MQFVDTAIGRRCAAIQRIQNEEICGKRRVNFEGENICYCVWFLWSVISTGKCICTCKSLTAEASTFFRACFFGSHGTFFWQNFSHGKFFLAKLSLVKNKHARKNFRATRLIANGSKIHVLSQSLSQNYVIHW